MSSCVLLFGDTDHSSAPCLGFREGVSNRDTTSTSSSSALDDQSKLSSPLSPAPPYRFVGVEASFSPTFHPPARDKLVFGVGGNCGYRGLVVVALPLPPAFFRGVCGSLPPPAPTGIPGSFLRPLKTAPSSRTFASSAHRKNLHRLTCGFWQV